MYAGFIIVLLLGGIGAVYFGASIPAAGIGIPIVALGAAAFCAGLVHIGTRLWDQESAKK
ncbi:MULTISPECIES: hypothetical protein [Microbacterium]|jgi:hypothetical protein|uniref:Uncharacterized protein n=1 Tax=Microbacterium natoriense TaxID=284570 RepID=A0AAW8EU13_9MICO|nr:hypothetical protein [Microbacterium natoriense]MDQ0646773.1 hypothetical protein [Microbacterium natoriense]